MLQCLLIEKDNYQTLRIKFVSLSDRSSTHSPSFHFFVHPPHHFFSNSFFRASTHRLTQQLIDYPPSHLPSYTITPLLSNPFHPSSCAPASTPYQPPVSFCLRFILFINPSYLPIAIVLHSILNLTTTYAVGAGVAQSVHCLTTLWTGVRSPAEAKDFFPSIPEVSKLLCAAPGGRSWSFGGGASELLVQLMNSYFSKLIYTYMKLKLYNKTSFIF
jgi:hypothetical protein